MKYYKCEECWESLAQYKDRDERNCENDNCKLAGLNQGGKEIEEWEVAQWINVDSVDCAGQCYLQ